MRFIGKQAQNPLPSGLKLVRAEPSGKASSSSDQFAGGVLSWEVGDLRVGQSGIIKCVVHVESVPEEGSLVMARISAPGALATSRKNVAYSHRYAPRAPARSRRTLWWVMILLAVLVVLWLILYARGGARRMVLAERKRPTSDKLEDWPDTYHGSAAA